MKSQLERLLADALRTLTGTLLPHAVDPDWISVERARDASHGDYASNIALRLAKRWASRRASSPRRSSRRCRPARWSRAPRWRAPGSSTSIWCAMPTARVLRQVLERGERYGLSDAARGERVILEFVSANPTGPLHVGHGRQAAYGATLGNLLRATGHDVHREYYINDAGRQMDILTLSTWLRYLERCGEALPFPSNGYRGDYVHAIAAQLEQRRGRELLRAAAQVLADLPADAPAGDKEQYIDALIARMRALLGSGGFDAGAGAGAGRDAGRHPRRSDRLRRRVRPLVLGARAGAQRRGRACAREARGAWSAVSQGRRGVVSRQPVRRR